MLTSKVKKYELSSEEEQAIRTVRQIISELQEEDFFVEYPFDRYCVDDCMCLLSDILINRGCAIG